jgi:uncharacterized membrane protein
VRSGHWHGYPHVRTGKDLTIGERAADRLKQGFGSWPFLITLNVFIGAWMLWNVLTHARFDPYPWLALNIILSWLAAQQGGALQIAANRGDRIASEVATGTHRMAEDLLTMNARQLEILEQMKDIHADIETLSSRVNALATPKTPMRPVKGAK